MQKPVIQQFRAAVEYVKTKGLAASNIEIGRVIGVKGSHITEILKERTLLKADQLQRFCTQFPVNPLFLLGFSDEIEVNTPAPERGVNNISEPHVAYTRKPTEVNASPKHTQTASPAASPTAIFEQLLGEKDRVITTQERAIEALQETVALLREKCAKL